MKTTLNKPSTFCLQTTDDRKSSMIKKIMEKISSLLLGMEPAAFKHADVLIVFSYTGEIVSKKLFDRISKFQRLNKKCYVYSDYSNTMREIIRIEKSEKNFETNSMYAVIVHAGMKIETYNQLVPKHAISEENTKN